MARHWQLAYVQISAGSFTDCSFCGLQLTMGPLLFFVYLVTAGHFLPMNCRLIGLQITPFNPHLALFTPDSFYLFFFFVQIANNLTCGRSFSFLFFFLLLAADMFTACHFLSLAADMFMTCHFFLSLAADLNRDVKKWFFLPVFYYLLRKRLPSFLIAHI